MPPRSYFYRDNKGDIRKFLYCCMCGEGPFKESEKNYKFISLNGKASHNYCIRCSKNIGLSQDDVVDKSGVTEKEKTEIIAFGETGMEKPVLIGYSEPEPTPPPPPTPPKPEIVDEPGPFYVYIGQFIDGTFITGATKDMYKDIETINSGKNDRVKKLPVEVVYYHMEPAKIAALNSKGYIMDMSPIQKEGMIKDFAEKFFEK